MAEENQAQQEPQQVTTKEPQRVTQVTKEPRQVTTKNPKKVEAGKGLAGHNRKKREEQRKEQAQLEKTGVNQYYGIRAVMGPAGPRPLCSLLALGVIGGLGYYIYRTKKGGGEVKDSSTMRNSAVSQQPSTKANKFEMD